MPTGVYDRKKAAPRGSKKKKLSQYPGPSENLQRLIDMQRELQERIDAERHRETAIAKLLRYARDAGLTPKDLRDAAKTLGDRNVGDEPVVSKHASKASRAAVAKNQKPAVGTIGKAVRKAREALGLSAAQLADRLHMAHSVVPMIERGKRKKFTEALAKRLADVLSLPVETFPLSDRKTPFPKVPKGPSSLNGAAAHG